MAKHSDWINELKTRCCFTEENAMEILQQETGRVFTQVLEDAGVFKCSEEGRAAFHAFIQAVNCFDGGGC